VVQTSNKPEGETSSMRPDAPRYFSGKVAQMSENRGAGQGRSIACQGWAASQGPKILGALFF